MPQLTFRQQQLIQIGQQNGLIQLTGSRIKYIAQGKEYNFTDPEEPVRAAAYVELVKHYNYPSNRIDFEQYAPSGSPQ